MQAPDLIVVPIGCGTNITAYAKGLREYRELGLIDKLPQLMGVQAENAAAVANSYDQRIKTITALESINTIASAIAVTNPIDGVKALDAIYQSKGCAVAVSDREILQAQYLLSTEEGLFVETASAAIAALMKTLPSGKYANQTVVCVLTGDGLKDLTVILNAASKPPTINADENEFSLLYEKNFFKSKGMMSFD